MNRTDHFSARFPAVHESLRNDVRRQQFVALAKFLEEDSVWETLATDANAFQDAVASQLVQN